MNQELVTSIIRQPGSTQESRAVMQVAYLDDIPVKVLPLEALETQAAVLRAGSALPIGSVEYLRAAMEAAEIPDPNISPYPQVLQKFLCRTVKQVPADSVQGICFLKPVQTKLFNGFIFGDPVNLEHDLEQFKIFQSLEPNEPVWVSDVVTWLSEVRYYVLNGEIIGRARYDPDGADDAPEPDIIEVQKILEALVSTVGSECTCGIDIGVLSMGETALVEVNDAWALGLYGGALTPRRYFELLSTRWKQICNGR